MAYFAPAAPTVLQSVASGSVLLLDAPLFVNNFFSEADFREAAAS